MGEKMSGDIVWAMILGDLICVAAGIYIGFMIGKIKSEKGTRS